MATSYTPDFYETIREGCRRSAEAVVPKFHEAATGFATNNVTGRREPLCQSVIDVGCGEGWWGKAFQDTGCGVLGIDGDYIENPVIDFRPCDLSQSLPDLGTFDLAVSLEVAEHLDPSRAEGFIADLCRLAPVVLFSAAIPGQGGADHRNEQWPDYWVEKFEANGYECSGALRWEIWSDERVENWYRQNLIVATSTPQHFPRLFDTPVAEVFPVVHPILFDARRA